MKALKDMPRIPVKVASEILNVSPQYIRIGLQRERLPIGTAVFMEKQWVYHISYELLKKYVGEEILNNYEKNKMEKCN